MEFSKNFLTAYKNFLTNKYKGLSETMIRTKLLFETASELISVFKPLIRLNLEKRYKGAELENKFTHYITELMAGLMHKKILPGTDPTFRGIVEASISELWANIMLDFNTDDTVINFPRSLLDGKPISILGEIKKTYGYTFNEKNVINDRAIKGRVKTLKSVIAQNGGKARVFLTANDVDSGHHYIRVSPSYSGSKYFKILPGKGTKTASYVDIDLSSSQSEKLLAGLAKISMSYVSRGGSLRRFGLLIKEEGSNPIFEKDYDTEMICMVSGDTFLSANEIFSQGESETGRHVYYDSVLIRKEVGSFDITRANNLWNIYSLYMPYNLQTDFDGLINIFS